MKKKMKSAKVKQHLKKDIHESKESIKEDKMMIKKMKGKKC